MSVPKINHKVLLYTVIVTFNNVLICLQDFLGGDTTFLDLEESERIEVEPRTGEHFKKNIDSLVQILKRMYKLKTKKSRKNTSVLGKLFFVKSKYLFYLTNNRHFLDFYDVNFPKNYTLNFLKFLRYRLGSDLPTRHLTRRFGRPFRKEVRTPYRRHVLRRKGGGRKRAQATKEKRQGEIRDVYVKNHHYTRYFFR